MDKYLAYLLLIYLCLHELNALIKIKARKPTVLTVGEIAFLIPCNPFYSVLI